MAIIRTGKPWESRMRYAPGVRVAAGDIVFTSGLVGRDHTGAIVAGGLKAQARQAFANVRDVLEAAGASMETIVKLTIYVTDMTQWEEVAAARAEFIKGPLPASAALEVRRLWDPECLVEVEAIAAVRDHRGETP